MNTVIIVDPDELSRRRQTNVAAQLGCQTIGTSCMENVPAQPLRETGVAVLAAASLGSEQLLHLISDSRVKAALIVVESRADESDSRLRRFAWHVGFRWHPDELAKVLVDALRTPPEMGSLSLVDLLRDLHHERSTARVIIDSAPAGEIVIVAGELVHAQRAHRNGLAALKDMLAHPGGACRVRPILSIPQTIAGDFKSTLLGVLEQLDDVNGAG